MNLLAADCETELITPGNVAPALVCMTTYGPSGVPQIYDAKDAQLVFYRAITDPNTTLIFHNAAFDLLVLAKTWGYMDEVFEAYEAKRIRDTGIRQRLMDIKAGRDKLGFVRPEGGPVRKAAYSLFDLEQLYFNYNDEQKAKRLAEKKDPTAWRLRYGELKGVPISQWPKAASAYAMEDAYNTYRVYAFQAMQMTNDTKDMLFTVPDEHEQTYAAWALHLISARGIQVSREKSERLEEVMLAAREANRRRLVQAGFLKLKKLPAADLRKGKTPDVTKEGVPYVYSKDMTRIKERVVKRYKRIGVPLTLTAKGSVPTDKDTLLESGSPLLELLSEEGGVEKIISTYLPVLKSGYDNPICCGYEPLLNTGRASSYRPSLQTIPGGRRVGGVRECFVPRPGYAFCSVDYDTLELRALAQVCLWMFGESKMAEALNAGLDLHLEVAAQLINTTYEDAVSRYKQGDPEVKSARGVAKCFHPDTEALTKRGWVKIGDLVPGEEVAAAIPGKGGDMGIKWQVPLAYQRLPATEGLVHLKNESIDLRVTPDHRMLAMTPAGSPKTVAPMDFDKVRAWWSAGILEGGSVEYAEDFVKLLAATQADGSYTRNAADRVTSIKFGFSKLRKIKRFKELLAALRIQSPERIHIPACGGKAVHSFVLRGDIVKQIADILPEKMFTWKLLELSLANRETLLTEIRFWDSHTPPNGTCYRFNSSRKQNADVLQAIACVTGQKARNTYQHYEYEGGQGTSYTVSVKQRNYARGGNVETTRLDYQGDVVCLTVQSDAVLVRDGGAPVITHQCANFGYPGGMGISKFVLSARKSYGVRIDEKTAKEVRDAWRKAWPEMRHYHEEIKRMTEGGSGTILQLGTQRIRGGCNFTEGANTLFQGLAASGAKEACVRVVKEAYSSSGTLQGLYPLAFVHDEICAEVDVDIAHELAYGLAEVMIQGMQKYIPDVKITASPVLSRYWTKDAKETFDENKRLVAWEPKESK